MNALEISWQGVINEIPCLCRWIIFLTFIFLMSKEVGLSWMKNRHEKEMRELSYKHEKEWTEIKQKGKNPDEELIRKNADLEMIIDKQKSSLQYEKEKNEWLQKQLDAYSAKVLEIIKNLK